MDHTSTLHPAVGHNTMKHGALVAQWEATLWQASLSCAQSLEVLWCLWTNIWEQLRRLRTMFVVNMLLFCNGHLASYINNFYKFSVKFDYDGCLQKSEGWGNTGGNVQSMNLCFMSQSWLTSNNNLPMSSPAISMSMKTNWCYNENTEIWIIFRSNKYN